MAPPPPEAMGERVALAANDNDETLEDPGRFAVDENLLHAQDVAATARA